MTKVVNCPENIANDPDKFFVTFFNQLTVLCIMHIMTKCHNYSTVA